MRAQDPVVECGSTLKNDEATPRTLERKAVDLYQSRALPVAAGFDPPVAPGLEVPPEDDEQGEPTRTWGP